MKTFKSNSIISRVLFLIIPILILAGCSKVNDGGKDSNQGSTSAFRVIVTQIDTVRDIEECLRKCGYCILPCDSACQKFCKLINSERVIVSVIDADSTVDSETTNALQGSLNIITATEKAYSLKNALNKERVNMTGNMTQFNEASDKLDDVIYKLDIMYKESIVKQKTQSPLLKMK